MKRSELFFMVIQLPVDFCMLLLSAVLAYALRFTDWAVSLRPVMFDLSIVQYLQVVLWVIPFWLLLFAFSGLYAPTPNRRFAQDIPRIIFATAAGLSGISLYILFAELLRDSRFLVATSAFLSVFFVILGRLLVRSFKGLCFRFGFGLREVVIIGDDKIGTELAAELTRRPELGYRVLALHKSFSEKVQDQLRKKLPDEILFANPRAHEKEAIEALEFTRDYHIDFKYSADLFSTLSINMAIHPLAGVPIVELRPTSLDGWGRVVKRVFDVFFSIFFLILLSPIFLLLSLIILIETGRPIIYKNERVGWRRHHFFTLKFRSMYQKDSTGLQFGKNGKQAEKREQALIAEQSIKSGPIYKIANDPRVTPFGRFLRRLSLDEIPQFVNVLRGEMSIVGPRPHQPREVSLYERKHNTVFGIKPGITGLSQISGRSDLSFEEEMRLDTLYIERWSLWLDLIICLKTPFVIFKKRRAL